MTERYSNHDELQNDLAAYALGSLEPADRSELETHIQTCPECREILTEYEQVVDLYPLATTIQEPPEGALTRLVDRAHASTARTSSMPPGSALAERNLRRLWIGFAALAALLLVMLGWNIWLQINVDNDYALKPTDVSVVVSLAGSDVAADASAHLLLNQSWNNGTFVATGLPAIGPGKDYQLWFVRPDGSRVSGGIFNPGSEGQITIQVRVPGKFSEFERIGVTEEPSGGSAGPTGPNILRGQLSSET